MFDSRAEQGDDPSCPTQLAGAREVLVEYDKLVDSLRARVAKLEAALTVAGAAMVDWLDAGYKLPHLIERIDVINAVIEDAPQ